MFARRPVSYCPSTTGKDHTSNTANMQHVLLLWKVEMVPMTAWSHRISSIETYF